MGCVKVDITKNERKFDADYTLSTPDAVRHVLDDFTTVCAEAARSNLAAVDLLVDLAVGLNDAGLTRNERRALLLVYGVSSDLSEMEAAQAMGVETEAVVAMVASACEKIARYFAGTEGYDGTA